MSCLSVRAGHGSGVASAIRADQGYALIPRRPHHMAQSDSHRLSLSMLLQCKTAGLRMCLCTGQQRATVRHSVEARCSPGRWCIYHSCLLASCKRFESSLQPCRTSCIMYKACRASMKASGCSFGTLLMSPFSSSVSPCP